MAGAGGSSTSGQGSAVKALVLESRDRSQGIQHPLRLPYITEITEMRDKKHTGSPGIFDEKAVFIVSPTHTKDYRYATHLPWRPLSIY